MSRRTTYLTLAIATLLIVATTTLLREPGNLGPVPTGEGESTVAEDPLAPPPSSRDAEGRSVPAPAPRTAPRSVDAAVLPAGAPWLELLVFHADGAAAARVTVLLLSANGGILDRATTDEEGRARIAAVSGPTRVLVFGATHPPHTEFLSTGSGTHRVVLRDGLSVAGHITVNGEVPDVPIAIGVLPDTWRPIETWERQLSAPLAGTDSRIAWVGVRAWQLTDERGQFRFGGLAEGWTGELRFPSGYRDRDGFAPEPTVAAGQVDLLVELTKAPMLRGRVLLPSGRIPAKGAQVICTIERADDGGSYTEHIYTDDKGRFGVELWWGPFESARLVFLSADYSAGRDLRVDELDEVHGTDLADIELQATRDVPFVTVDVDGEPVAGASARTDDPTGVFSGPTDWNGDGVLCCVLRDTRTMTVWGPNHSSVTVDIPEVINEPLTVTLDSCTIVDLVIAGLDGPAPEGLVLRVASIGGPLYAEASWSDRDVPDYRNLSTYGRLQTKALKGLLPGSRPGLLGGLCTYDFGLASGGASERFSFPCVSTDVRIVFLVLDSLGAVGASAVLAPIPGEHHETLMTVADPARPVRIRVRDTSGIPVAGAKVLATVHGFEPAGGADAAEIALAMTEDAMVRSSLTGDDGETSIAPTFASRLDLRATKDGIGATVQTGVPIPHDGRVIELTLAPTRTLAIELRDANGRSVRPQLISVQMGLVRVATPRPGDGLSGGADPPLWIAENVPSGPLTVVARVSGRRFEAQVGGDDDSALIVVPTTTDALVSWTADLADGRRRTLVLRAKAGDQGAVWIPLGAAELIERAAWLSSIFPGIYDVTVEPASSDERLAGEEYPTAHDVSIELDRTTLVQLLR